MMMMIMTIIVMIVRVMMIVSTPFMTRSVNLVRYLL